VSAVRSARFQAAMAAARSTARGPSAKHPWHITEGAAASLRTSSDPQKGQGRMAGSATRAGTAGVLEVVLVAVDIASSSLARSGSSCVRDLRLSAAGGCLRGPGQRLWLLAINLQYGRVLFPSILTRVNFCDTVRWRTDGRGSAMDLIRIGVLVAIAVMLAQAADSEAAG